MQQAYVRTTHQGRYSSVRTLSSTTVPEKLFINSAAGLSKNLKPAARPHLNYNAGPRARSNNIICERTRKHLIFPVPN
jgi:hypothetical protein